MILKISFCCDKSCERSVVNENADSEAETFPVRDVNNPRGSFYYYNTAFW